PPAVPPAGATARLVASLGTSTDQLCCTEPPSGLLSVAVTVTSWGPIWARVGLKVKLAPVPTAVPSSCHCVLTLSPSGSLAAALKTWDVPGGTETAKVAGAKLPNWGRLLG